MVEPVTAAPPGDNGADAAAATPAPCQAGLLTSLPWVQTLLAQPGVARLLTVGAMSDANEGLDPDHLFLAMLREGLLRDVLFLFDAPASKLHLLLALGSNVAGHPRITHGGFTSAVCDEATGGLVFELKKAGRLGSGAAFTARLEVDYKKPLPVNTVVVCTAEVDYMEGRKVWTKAEMRDQPDGTVFAAGRALYVTARTEGQQAA